MSNNKREETQLCLEESLDGGITMIFTVTITGKELWSGETTEVAQRDRTLWGYIGVPWRRWSEGE